MLGRLTKQADTSLTRVWIYKAYQPHKSAQGSTVGRIIILGRAILLCSCPYVVMLPTQLTLLPNKSIYGALSGSRDRRLITVARETQSST